MKKLIILLFVFVIVGCSKKMNAQSGSRETGKTTITGVWKVEQFAVRDPNSTWTIIKQQNESLYLFTNKYYGYSYARGTKSRTLFEGDPNKPSDSEKIAAYDSFVANSGSYTLKDSMLILTAVIHKNPNEMGGKSLTYKIHIEKDRLEMTIINPPFFPGREWKTNLIRIE